MAGSAALFLRALRRRRLGRLALCEDCGDVIHCCACLLLSRPACLLHPFCLSITRSFCLLEPQPSVVDALLDKGVRQVGVLLVNFSGLF